ncbi:hypothetical protein [Paraburkholderia sp.]|uniref:hypothetical protein n=1 Tax=Paraburkholderia sp. TaxID=1926495 RepID=UPI003C749BC8
MGNHFRISRRGCTAAVLVGIVWAVPVQRSHAADLAASSASATAGTSAPATTSPRGNVGSQPEQASTGRTRSTRAKSATVPDPGETAAHGEEDEAHAGNAKPGTAIPVPPETASVTRHTVTLDGRKLAYTAAAGNLLLHNDAGEATASVFYVAYVADSKTPSNRPVTFCSTAAPAPAVCF